MTYWDDIEWICFEECYEKDGDNPEYYYYNSPSILFFYIINPQTLRVRKSIKSLFYKVIDYLHKK